MAQVLVRDIDDAVIDRLKVRAQHNGRSLEAELRMILQRASTERDRDWRAELERVRAMFTGRTFSDSAELIREDRDR